MTVDHACFLIMPQLVAKSCLDNEFRTPTVEEIKAELSGEMRELLEGESGE